MDRWSDAYGSAGELNCPSDNQEMAVWNQTPSPDPLMVYGRMAGEFDPAKCPQAKLFPHTTCAVCGHGFRAGDTVYAHLAVPPAEGTWRHDRCETPVTSINSARYRGFGIGTASGTA